MAADIPQFNLNTGDKIPSVGLGVWMGREYEYLPCPDTVLPSRPLLTTSATHTEPGAIDTNGRSTNDAVAHALKSGYRHIDTAALYQDEKEVSFQDAILPSTPLTPATHRSETPFEHLRCLVMRSLSPQS